MDIHSTRELKKIHDRLRSGIFYESDSYFVENYLLSMLNDYNQVKRERQAMYINDVFFPTIIEYNLCFKKLLSFEVKEALHTKIVDLLNDGCEGAYYAYIALYGDSIDPITPFMYLGTHEIYTRLRVI